MEYAVEVEKLVKRYKELVALDHFDMTIREGEIFGLLGPNGSGKTTTVNCILSLLKYDKGNIRVFGREMKPNEYDLKRQIGVVFQEVAVFDELTVRDNIDYFCGLYIDDKAMRKQYVDDAIKFVGLESYEKFVPGKLSGGLLRRLNIACGIAHKPKLIFFDEPTVAVDPQSRNNILEGIMKLREQGSTIVYTSHYMEEVEQICDRILIMDKGRAVATGTAEELKNMTKTRETITLEADALSNEDIGVLRELPHVYDLKYEDGLLSLYYSTGRNNLVRVVNYLQEKDIAFTNVHSKLPTLNDVFLEITGKELRD